MLKKPLAAIIVLLALGSLNTHGQQSERFDQYELHHSVVYTTFLSAEIAARYGIVRGHDKAMLTLSVRDADTQELAGMPMEISGQTWDLIQSQTLALQEIREGRATYYIAPFEFIDREWRFFEFEFQPKGSEKRYRYKFKTQLWKQDP